jgi:hypothetical protein
MQLIIAAVVALLPATSVLAQTAITSTSPVAVKHAAAPFGRGTWRASYRGRLRCLLAGEAAA